MEGANGHPQPRALSKASFFGALENLDESDDDHLQPDDCLSFGRVLAASRRSTTTSVTTPAPIPNEIITPVAPSNQEAPSLIRANTAPQPSSISSHKNHCHLNNRTTATMSATLNGSSTRKRKATALKTIPEAQQVFKGLVFCKSTLIIY